MATVKRRALWLNKYEWQYADDYHGYGTKAICMQAAPAAVPDITVAQADRAARLNLLMPPFVHRMLHLARCAQRLCHASSATMPFAPG